MSKKSIASLVGIILGIILLISGFATTVPDRMLPSFVSRSEREETGEGTPQYVGGDAYNFLMEASIRSGEIAGARTARAIYISSGVLLITISAMTFVGEFDQKKEILSVTSTADESVERTTQWLDK